MAGPRRSHALPTIRSKTASRRNKAAGLRWAGGALWSAVRHQSVDNAPLLVFATVGTVLTIFMLKS